jgi:hypothetical protein
VLLDVEVLNGALEEFFFCGHSPTRISTFGTGLARDLWDFNKKQGLSTTCEKGDLSEEFHAPIHLPDPHFIYLPRGERLGRFAALDDAASFAFRRRPRRMLHSIPKAVLN